MRDFRWITIVGILISQISQAQYDEDIDSLFMVELDNAVITGQYSAQSVDKSLYHVEVISTQDIKNQAGNTIADVLSQNLNIMITPSSGTGDSQIEMMGLGGGYVKVLVDNIPLVSDSGFGNNIDLTKINLDNVERIEIVKGAMGVDYGSNAMAGIINIITKKTQKSDWRFNFMIQEETVGNEYDWYENGGVHKGKGRHIQAFEIGKRISSRWNFSAGVNRNDFQGYWSDRKGRKYFGTDGKRGYEWLPKEQWNSFATLNYKSRNFSAFYKLSYLNEKIEYHNPNVRLINLDGGERTFHADDRDFFTSRWVHHLNINARLFDKILYNGDFSYQTQKRKFEDYIYDVPTRQEILRKDPNVFLSTQSYYSRGTFSNFIDNKAFDFQVGYEFDSNKGFANAFADSFVFGENLDKEVNTYAAFASTEIFTASGLSIRPGFRASFSNKFKTQYNYSLNGKFDLTENSNIRAVIGTANRYPNFSELYSYQVDSNHNILGDENLVPEFGYSTSIQWNKRYRFGDFLMENNISTLYLDVSDRIELVQLDPMAANYQYMNINKFKSWGVSTEHRFSLSNFNLNLGASLFGTSKILSSDTYNSNNTINDRYHYTIQGRASANYSVPKWGTTFSVYYKYTGRTTQYVADTENSVPTNTVFRLAEREGYNMLDASIRKGFYNNRFEVTFGARNLLDITTITDTSIIGSGHTGASTGKLSLFYGRSYFLKLNYNLEF